MDIKLSLNENGTVVNLQLNTLEFETIKEAIGCFLSEAGTGNDIKVAVAQKMDNVFDKIKPVNCG